MPLTRRKPLRIQRYDYTTPGAYFVTVGAHRRQMLFEDETMAEIIRNVWSAIPNHFVHVDVDEFVVMPNHIHGIIWIAKSRVGAQHAAPLRSSVAPGSLGAIVRSFKSAVTRRVNQIRHTPGAKLWQRNYYDHVIRDEDELHRVREYIRTNPLKWQLDHENPHHVPNSGDQRDWGWLEKLTAIA